MKIALIIIIVLLVVGVVVFGGLLTWYYTSGKGTTSTPGTDNPGDNIIDPSFPLSHDGKVLGSTLGATTDEYRIDVNAEEFDVKIIANDKCVFEFRHDESINTFPYLDKDWGKYFDLKKGDGYFTFDNSNRSLLKFFSDSLYAGEDIEAISNVEGDVAFFGIVVTIGEKNYVVNLTDWYATKITLSTEEVYF